MRRLIVALLVIAAVPLHAQVAYQATGYVSSLRSTGDNTVLPPGSPIGEVRFELEAQIGGGGEVGVLVGDRVSLDLGVMYLRPEARLVAGGFGLGLGSIQMVPITLAVRYHFPSKGPLHVYAGAGGAYVRFGEIDSDVLELFDEEEADLDDAAGYLLNGGASFDVSPRFAIVFDAKYFPVESAIEAQELPVDIDLNPLILSFGLRLR